MQITIKQRKDLKGADVQAKIFLYCFLQKKPLTCYEIAKGIKKDRQLVAYHLPKLVEGGELIEYEKKYMINPVFLDEKVWNKYYDLMIEFVKVIKDKIIFPENSTKEEKEEIIKNVIEIFPILFMFEIEEEF